MGIRPANPQSGIKAPGDPSGLPPVREELIRQAIGIVSITRNTVKAILKRNGYDIGPNRGPGTWDEFLKRHAKTMGQCDFFSRKIVSKTGLRDIFVLVFLNVKTRQVYITPSTYKPDQAWMIVQAEAFIKHTQVQKLPCKILMHDNDGKYSKPFLDVFKKAKIKPLRRTRVPVTIRLSGIRCEERLGGLLKSYSPVAA